MAKSIKKQFGKYEVKSTANGKFAIYYVWSARDKELFADNQTAYSVLVRFRDMYSHKGSDVYEAVKEYFLPLIANEF